MAQPEITDAPVSVDELMVSAFELKVFPNPAGENVQIGFTALGINPYEILLLSQSGQVVLQKRGTSNIGDNQIALDISDFPAGDYHFLVKVGNSTANEGFVKVN